MLQYACRKHGLRKDDQVITTQRQLGLDIISYEACIKCGYPVDIVRTECYMGKDELYVWEQANEACDRLCDLLECWEACDDQMIEDALMDVYRVMNRATAEIRLKGDYNE